MLEGSEFRDWDDLIDHVDKNPDARRLLDQEAVYLSAGLINLINLIPVDTIYLAGDICYRYELLAQRLQREIIGTNNGFLLENGGGYWNDETEQYEDAVGTIPQGRGENGPVPSSRRLGWLQSISSGSRLSDDRQAGHRCGSVLTGMDSRCLPEPIMAGSTGITPRI